MSLWKRREDLEDRSRITEGDLKLFPQLTVNEGITCTYLGCMVANGFNTIVQDKTVRRESLNPIV